MRTITRGCLLLAVLGAVRAMQGGLQLDENNFDKVVDGTRTVLAKFDKPLRGPQDTQFRDLAAFVTSKGSGTKLLVVDVNVQDHGAHMNERLRDRFGLVQEELPVFLLFVAGTPVHQPVRHTGPFTIPALKKFVADAGVYVGEHGTLEALHPIARAFAAAAGDVPARAGLLVQAQQASLEYTDTADVKSAGVYVKVMEKILAEGDGYTEHELARAKRVASGAKVWAKAQELKGRANILASFVVNDATQEL